MTLSVRAMRYVQSALQLGSIAAAAEAMHVAPSAIATALKQAEDTFGVVLATRARAKGIFPTRAGRDVLRRIDDLLERYDSLLCDVADLKSGLSGTLAIGYNAPIAPAFLPAICAPMLAAHPDVALSFVEGDNTSVQKGLLDGRFDVILFVADLPNPQIATRPLIHAPTYCLCPADHPFAASGAVPVSQIAGEPLILLDRPAARGYYMELLEQSGETFRIVATANSTEMVRSLVAAGIGVSLLNMRPRDVPPYAGSEVRCLPVSGASSGVTLSLGFPPGPKRRLVQMFVDGCADFLQGPKGVELIVPNQLRELPTGSELRPQ
ncbi:LysR substrate-binding domain-containing protein [Sedimentitalea arenosa]|uniref:LysR family transcriptional regulator n=1 Tax=Sedimentitalea arenosa TaxID=2798803 RepID=A0A8J7IRM3_9RHOB|nr:LysR substrate-binding domain-containing protein [Arenibacterium arenosum]MBJ6369912.1 LysR family transcriptional regulator [Arenibacterium arenosum]